jgi:enoyl-CoA hydratase/carnithine racemase
MAYETLLVETKDRICTITMNRPERLNALSQELTLELGDVTQEIARSGEDIRCVVLTGAGRAFCAGGDTRGMAGGQEQRAPRSNEDIRRGFWAAQRMIQGFIKLEVPTIAMVNGDAVGAGFDLACACDIVTASENARFMVAYRRIGLIPGYGGAWLYQRRIGLNKAAELMFTGDFMPAAEAYRIGMASFVCPREELESRTWDLASRIAAGPPISLRLMKILLYRGDQTDLDTAMQMAAFGSSITLSSEDHREGVTAMREKRQANYIGR